jgi:hypothetical protein
MLNESGVQLIFSSQVESVAKEGTTIKSLTLTDNTIYTAKVFIDASYEGDLFARAGVSYTVGREGFSTYNESLAGMSAGAGSNNFNLAVNPFDDEGNPLPFTQLPQPGSVVRGGDKRVQSYNFRLCVTKDSTNMVSGLQV